MFQKRTLVDPRKVLSSLSKYFVKELPLPLSIIIGDLIYAANSDKEYTIGSQSLTSGESPITMNNIPYVLSHSVVAIISGKIIMLLSQENPSPLVLEIGNEAYTADSLSNVVAASQTLIPRGSARAIDNTPYVLAPFATPVTPYNISVLTIKRKTVRQVPRQTMSLEVRPLRQVTRQLLLVVLAIALAPPATTALISGDLW